MSTRFFSEKELVIASHNDGKVKEISELLSRLPITIFSAANFDLSEPEETGATFCENAELKAKIASDATGLPALADDSGLVVHALDGAPGIYSARWAGPERDFDTAMKRVNSSLSGKANKSAAFVCALSLAWPDGYIATFEGCVTGNICWPPKGENGFGYDAIFIADGMDKTFAEIDPKKKHAISHRADAFKQLTKSCFAMRTK